MCPSYPAMTISKIAFHHLILSLFDAVVFSFSLCFESPPLLGLLGNLKGITSDLVASECVLKLLNEGQIEFINKNPYKPENTEKPLPVWIQSHGTDKGFEDAKPVIAALKNKGISAIGAAGFCWGGLGFCSQ
ncbi:hypothetical protein LOK49_LG03G00808 [Camellia lanceoleosa]|uniref:Uncharacterized protein n=1 Tax=Camellia lanceoleosa TaxID=1840588 RepID=A0ACC0IFL8_9ERIC|nr:hypothetical protein LOK49_LG03G00808 [Camellia lanceoleosa]